MTEPDPAASEVPKRAFRLMVREYALVRDLAVTPVNLDWAAPSVHEAVNFLLTQKLVTQEGKIVSISDRGRRLLGLPILIQTAYTVAFDPAALDG